MKVEYKGYLSVPTIETNKMSERIAIHCHREDLSTSSRYYNPYNRSDRKVMRNKTDEQIRKINTCMAFFKGYKASVTSAVQKAD